MRSFRMVNDAPIDPTKPVLCTRCERVHPNFVTAMRICGGAKCPPKRRTRKSPLAIGERSNR